jgi:hypothetical protein
MPKARDGLAKYAPRPRLPAFTLDVMTDSGDAARIRWEGMPTECPLCRRHISPRQVHQNFCGPVSAGRLQLVFLCPALLCRRLFIVTYSVKGDLTGPAGPGYGFACIEPIVAKSEEFSSWIQQASPSFGDIYNQAFAAEQFGLADACGPAYRKALEFLIKDFLIQRKPNEVEAVRGKFLGRCIEEDVEDERIKKCAERAAWLGNDVTHYERRFTNHDVDDLKRVIRLTVRWIENVLETEDIEQTIQRGGS